MHALEQPFLGSVRLFINAAHLRVVRAVSGDAPTAEASAIRSTIYFDVAKSLILGALASEEFLERHGDYGEGSCGSVIFTMIQMLFPGDGLSGLAGLLRLSGQTISIPTYKAGSGFSGAEW
ncbi:hypothetical protein ACPA9J_01200 [Pseudomonas aeruginosa]